MTSLIKHGTHFTHSHETAISTLSRKKKKCVAKEDIETCHQHLEIVRRSDSVKWMESTASRQTL